MAGPAGNKSLQIVSGNQVAAIYESKWHISQVLQFDKSDDTYFVAFRENIDPQN